MRPRIDLFMIDSQSDFSGGGPPLPFDLEDARRVFKGMARFFWSPRKESPTMIYAFCEAATAGPKSKWHIRQLTEVGPKFGGGADTPSLCGREVAWDLEVDITAHHLQHACPECAERYWGVKGDRVRLVKFADELHSGLALGMEGLILEVDCSRTRHIKWDSGLELGLCPGDDEWEVIEHNPVHEDHHEE